MNCQDYITVKPERKKGEYLGPEEREFCFMRSDMKRNLLMIFSIATALASIVLIILFCIALMTIADIRKMLLFCIALGVPAMILLAISVTSYLHETNMTGKFYFDCHAIRKMKYTIQ